MKRSTLKAYKERMLRVLVYIQQHLDDELSLEELAGVACFSPYHFHRIFRGMLGESVGEHIRRLRLERAASQLKRSDKPIIKIALEAGYETHEAFSRAFKAMESVSPSEFRSCSRSTSRISTASGVHYRGGKQLKDFNPICSGGEIMEVRIQNIEPMRAAFVRHTGPYGECSTAWGKLTAQLGRQGMLGGDTRFIGICYDDPEITPPEKLRYDACVTVNDDFEAEGEIGLQTITGGQYAVTTHFGAYEKLGETYAKLLGEWLPMSGRELRSAPCLECYLNDPDGTEPEDLITDIYAPLEPR
ncbi:MAG: AraC family transcriptional regulator [Armatimonadota bacterium]|nr:MAG: AraC family transcriptional regulator [Armatimonadota bacterium]